MRLEDFPPEILHKIVDELDDVSKACLKSTSYYFRCTINIDVAKLSVCSKWLLLCRFETDYYALMKAYPPRVACALCKMKVRQECIHAQSLRSFARSNGSDALRLMQKKPVERFCVLHVPQLLQRGDIAQHQQNPRWTKESQLTCLHCGRDVAANDCKSVGCDACQCDVCPRAIQPRFVASGYLASTRCDPWFEREDGKLYSRLWISDKSIKAL